jgi:hypothetical protein
MKFHKPDVKHILLATDFSEKAEHAFGYAASLADAHDAAVAILHVLENIPAKAELMIVLFEELEDEKELRKKDEAEIPARVKHFIERYCSAFKDRFPACRLISDGSMQPTAECSSFCPSFGDGRSKAWHRTAST